MRERKKIHLNMKTSTKKQAVRADKPKKKKTEVRRNILAYKKRITFPDQEWYM